MIELAVTEAALRTQLQQAGRPHTLSHRARTLA
jgi:hypothetical protein